MHFLWFEINWQTTFRSWWALFQKGRSTVFPKVFIDGLHSGEALAAFSRPLLRSSRRSLSTCVFHNVFGILSQDPGTDSNLLGIIDMMPVLGN